jgi:hypothetical protein
MGEWMSLRGGVLRGRVDGYGDDGDGGDGVGVGVGSGRVG